MSKITQSKIFRTPDGTVFENLKAAKEHAAVVERIGRAQAVVDKLVATGETLTGEGIRNALMTVNPTLLLELAKVLKSGKVLGTTKTRTPKAAKAEPAPKAEKAPRAAKAAAKSAGAAAILVFRGKRGGDFAQKCASALLEAKADAETIDRELAGLKNADAVLKRKIRTLFAKGPVSAEAAATPKKRVVKPRAKKNTADLPPPPAGVPSASASGDVPPPPPED